MDIKKEIEKVKEYYLEQEKFEEDKKLKEEWDKKQELITKKLKTILNNDNEQPTTKN